MAPPAPVPATTAAAAVGDCCSSPVDFSTRDTRSRYSCSSCAPTTQHLIEAQLHCLCGNNTTPTETPPVPSRQQHYTNPGTPEVPVRQQHDTRYTYTSSSRAAIRLHPIQVQLRKQHDTCRETSIITNYPSQNYAFIEMFTDRNRGNLMHCFMVASGFPIPEVWPPAWIISEQGLPHFSNHPTCIGV